MAIENVSNEANKNAISDLADQIKAGDDALNKLKIQNLDRPEPHNYFITNSYLSLLQTHIL